jgi:semaphorin 6
VFTTPPNSISGSAVCAFALQDITDTFEGNFKEQAQLNYNWLPVPSAKVVAEMWLQYSLFIYLMMLFQ